MHLPSLFVAVVYISGYLFLLFAAVCLACGLYYLVELAEEYTVFTKKLIRITILVQLVLHSLLYLYERFPLLHCSVGFLAHIVYLQLLRSFPFIEPSSPQFLLSVLMFAVDNYLWFTFFRSDSELFYKYRVAPGPAISSFFLLVIWLVPCAFFCSLTVNDSVLPSAASGAPSMPGYVPNGGMETLSGEKKKRSRNILMLAFDSTSFTVRRILGMPQNRQQQLHPTTGDMFSSSGSAYR